MDVGGAWLRDLKPSQMLFATLNSGFFSGAKQMEVEEST